ncbi:NUDIX domain-containing protein [Streptomyces sp. NPDC005931]|uniref:NUDIX domain-containing protein n=1 Tax=Streptomyces sp. NPDC005931 TaxID=3364737 RepID=UPI0036795926
MAEVPDAARLTFVEVEPPVLSVGQRRAMDRLWDEAVRDSPGLFDGPAVGCAGVRREASGEVVVSWVRASYRYRMLRRVPGAPRVPSLFVSVVQPAEDGRLVVGQMASWTASPGRWQLPGGSAEPPVDAGEPLDTRTLRRHAARELAEETGIGTAPGELSLWHLTRGANGSLGVLFLAPPRAEADVRARFDALVAAEEAAGRVAEFERVSLVRSAEELDGPAAGSRVDYLEAVLRKWAGQD